MVISPVKNGNETALVRGEYGRFLPGNPGGPGRPPNELSITQHLREKAWEAVREGAPSRVEELAEHLWHIALQSTDTRLKLDATRLLDLRTQNER